MTKARDIADLLDSSGQVDTTKITLPATEIPDLDTSKITTGTFDDNRISASSVTQHVTAFDDNQIQANISLLGFKTAVNGSLSKFNLVDQIVDEYVDNSGIDTSASTGETLGGSGTLKYFSGTTGSTGSTVTTTYSYDGSDDTISLNSGESITGTIKCWGAGGGGDSPGSGQTGGGGGFISGSLSYTSDGSDLIISVGQGGIYGPYGGSAGSGGGYSGAFIGSKSHGNSLIIAGAGGGAGDNGLGGGGGGTTGASGTGSNPGAGGSQSAGGAPGAVGGDVRNPTAGSALQGGDGGDDGVGSKGPTVTSRAFNGGGDGGEEPGGKLGGGGAGGGYYGGGGGSSQTSGGGGGGGSSYYNSSYISSVTNTQGTTGGAAAGTGDSNYPGGVGDGGGNGNNGENGAVWISYQITSLTVNDMTLVSNNYTASTTPSSANMVLLMEDATGTATINTDIKGYISRDGGTTYTQGTLVDEGSWGTNKKVLAFHDLDISSQPSGTSMKYKIETANQSASKDTRVHATSIGWK